MKSVRRGPGAHGKAREEARGVHEEARDLMVRGPNAQRKPQSGRLEEALMVGGGPELVSNGGGLMAKGGPCDQRRSWWLGELSLGLVAMRKA